MQESLIEDKTKEPNRFISIILLTIATFVRSTFLAPVILLYLFFVVVIMIMIQKTPMAFISYGIAHLFSFLAFGNIASGDFTLNTQDFLRIGWRSIFAFSLAFNFLKIILKSKIKTRTPEERSKRNSILITVIWLINALYFYFSTKEQTGMMIVILFFYVSHLITSSLYIAIDSFSDQLLDKMQIKES